MYEVVSAKNEILGIAPSVDVIFIGEHHLFPYHRVFVHSLLDSLYKIGYRYLFLESLNYNKLYEGDSDFDAFSFEDGYYVKESNMANLIKMAHQLGITILPYEIQAFQWGKAVHDMAEVLSCPDGGSFMEPDGTIYTLEEGEKRFSYRDYIQAFNLLEQLKGIKGKSIVLGGEMHNRIHRSGCLTTTGYWLNELSTYKILNVGQSITSFKNLDNFEEPVVLKKNDTYFSEEYSISDYPESAVEIEVFYPPSLVMSKLYKSLLETHFVCLKMPKQIRAPYLVLVFDAKYDISRSVPILTKYYQTHSDEIKLVLPCEHGDVVYYVKDSSGMIYKISSD